MKRFPKITFTFIFTLSLGLAFVQSVSAQGVERPKLVVGIVVDQMRWDYLYRYYDLYCDGGFKRMMREGFNCENTMINYLPAFTAVGHASIFTGTVPAVHGIVGNSFFIDDKRIYCCEDKAVKSVGTDTDAGQCSPKNMLSTTIGDELKVATSFASKVVGVALKDRAAILPAGHSADAAFWMDFKKGVFVTSTYYMKELPKWASDYNKTIGKVTKAEIQYTVLGNKLTEEMAKAAIEGEQLGQRGQTDMLTLSFSCTDMIGHKYGTHHPKTQETYLDVDKRLADLFDYLDRTVGKGQYLAFLAADHGAANNILMMREHHIPADGFFSSKVEKELDEYLAGRFGTTEKLVSRFGNDYIFLNHKAIETLKLNADDVKTAIIRHLEKNPIFAYLVDLERVSDTPIPAIVREKMINGHNRRRCGDIRFVLQPGYYEIYGKEIDGGTTHGSWNPYDAHVPFLLMGWHVTPGATQAKASITDIAPTVCAMIHVQMPNGCIGSPVIQVTK